MNWFNNISKLTTILENLSVRDRCGSELGHDESFLSWKNRTVAIRNSGRRVFLIGNGASASMASHSAADLAKNGRIRTEVFTDFSSVTATANDISYEQIFAEPLRLKMTEGIAATRNTGMGASKGKYIAFLDQDDIWLNDKLKNQIQVFEQATENPGMVCTGMYFVDSVGVVFRQFNGYAYKDQRKMIKDMFFSSINSGSIMMIKTECMNAVGLFDEDFVAYDDFDYWMRTAKKFNIQYINVPLVKKRFHGSNTSLHNLSVFPDTIKAYHKACQTHTFLNKYKNKKLADIYCKYGFEILTDNNTKMGRKYLLTAIHYSYFCWQALLIYLFSFLGKSGVDLLILMQRVKRFIFGFSSGIYVSKTGRT